MNSETAQTYTCEVLAMQDSSTATNYRFHNEISTVCTLEPSDDNTACRAYYKPKGEPAEPLKTKIDYFHDEFPTNDLPNNGYALGSVLCYRGDLAGTLIDGIADSGAGIFCINTKSAFEYNYFTPQIAITMRDGILAPLRFVWYDKTRPWLTYKGPWIEGESVTAGERVIHENYEYTRDATGTNSSTPPTHSSGSANDYTFVKDLSASPSDRGVRAIFGEKDDTPTAGHATADFEFQEPVIFATDQFHVNPGSDPTSGSYVYFKQETDSDGHWFRSYEGASGSEVAGASVRMDEDGMQINGSIRTKVERTDTSTDATLTVNPDDSVLRIDPSSLRTVTAVSGTQNQLVFIWGEDTTLTDNAAIKTGTGANLTVDFEKFYLFRFTSSTKMVRVL